MTSREQYDFERGRYQQYQANAMQRLSCASSPAARQQIADEGDQIRANLDRLADQVRAERNAAPSTSRLWALVPRNADATPATAGTAEGRYRAAVAYVQRAIATITPSWLNLIERPAADEKTAPYRHELSHVQARWSVARTEQEHAAIAREAELLADRTEETMPGAPQDWKRTNLWKGEVQKHAGATSYLAELLDMEPSAVAVGDEKHSPMTKYVVGAVAGAGAILALRALLR